MFRLSKAAEYSIRGILYLSMQGEKKVSYVEEISEAQDVPKQYLAKLFQGLAKKGFLKSTRGQGGGFILISDPQKLSILEIIEAMEGPIFLNDCLIRVGFCERSTLCPVHDLWKDAQESFLEVLRSTTFDVLAERGRIKIRNAGDRVLSALPGT